ncbi:hypothetical protein B9Z55_009929 [Caenorhabditis nigoni]|uniref:Uncharacterized protein n=1 Tax=Caenorhabditis nigoni TaxID=1611254 RepID=A0A2G5UTZ1_9PELO|nr:hypothetical protein B9Z55_009929 [Caenorhabditis nigoni]
MTKLGAQPGVHGSEDIEKEPIKIDPKVFTVLQQLSSQCRSTNETCSIASMASNARMLPLHVLRHVPSSRHPHRILLLGCNSRSLQENRNRVISR